MHLPKSQPLLLALRSKFAQDTVWNVGSMVLLAACGLGLNLFIAARFGPQALGSFNLVYAIYAIASQISPMGVHLSGLKYAAQYATDRPRLEEAVFSGLWLTLISGVFWSGALYLAAGLLGRIFGGPAVAAGVVCAAPGLLCFTLNKYMLGVANGLRHMRAYAVFMALRAVGIMGTALVALASEWPGERLPLILTFSEGMLSLALLLYLTRLFPPGRAWLRGGFTRRHATFGLKSLPVGMMAEVNARVDVLLLGVFTRDFEVGIYSLGAMLTEGFNQLPFVFKRNMDPILTRLIITGQLEELRVMVRRGTRLGGLAALILGAAVVLAYPLAVHWVVRDPTFLTGWGVCGILIAGAAVQASYLPFSGILVQGGFPGYQAIVSLLMGVVNLGGGLALIPFLGTLGAAIAASVSSASMVLFLKFYTRKILGVTI